MNAEIFWNIIGDYNSKTWLMQSALMLLIAITGIYSATGRKPWTLKLSLGLSHLFIAGAFFFTYGTEPVQHFFALPLFAAIGLLFIIDAVRHKDDTLQRFTYLQWILFVAVLLYPVVSMELGRNFPQMVVYIMPCPLVSLSIVLYSGYGRRNRILLVLLMIWGLTGVKSFFFNALEDTILLACGLYCIYPVFRRNPSQAKKSR